MSSDPLTVSLPSDFLANDRRSPVTPASISAAQLLTAEQLADRWQVTTAHIYRLSREGQIPTVTVGRYRRYRLEAIEAWERAQEATS